MKMPSSISRLLASTLLSLSAPGLPPLRAADQPKPQDIKLMVIENGEFSPNGPKATLGSVIDLLRPRYGGFASIILAGTTHVPIHRITLRLSDSIGNDPELNNVLLALSEASGRAFEVKRDLNLPIYTLSPPLAAGQTEKAVESRLLRLRQGWRARLLEKLSAP